MKIQEVICRFWHIMYPEAILYVWTTCFTVTNWHDPVAANQCSERLHVVAREEAWLLIEWDGTWSVCLSIHRCSNPLGTRAHNQFILLHCRPTLPNTILLWRSTLPTLSHSTSAYLLLFRTRARDSGGAYCSHIILKTSFCSV